MIWTLLLASGGALAAEATLDERFLAGLRARRLFTLAEKYCVEEVRRSDLSPTQRAALLIELARTHAEHALHSAPQDRAEQWRAAHEVVADYQTAFPDSPRLLLVRLQDALTWLAEGELARQEAQIVGDQAPPLDAARQALRTAAGELEQLAEEIDVLLRRQLRRPADAAEELTADELAALEKHVAYQRARVYRNQALCYPEGSADRANSLTQALERLDRLAELAVADEMVWRSRADQVVCYRLLGDMPRATQSLATLVKAGPPPSISLQAQAEKIRLLLAQKRVDEALAAVAQGRTVAGEVSAELDLAHLESQIAAAQAAAAREQREEVEQWQRTAARQVRQIERAHGPYWMRRAEIMLGRSVSGSAGGDVEALARAAESLYRSGQIDEALAAYDQARARATGERAFDLGFTAAAIEHARGQRGAAAERFEKLALAERTQRRASEAHLLAVVNLAELIRDSQDAQQAAWLERYAKALETHVTLWPDATTADEARLWLGDLRRSRRAWAEAVAAYRAVAPTAGQREKAVRAMADCYTAWLAERTAAGEAAEPIVTEAIANLTEAFAPAASGWPREFDSLSRFCVLQIAEWQLKYQPQNAAATEALLGRALQSAADAPEAFRSEAATLLVCALAAQGKPQQAAAVMDQVSAGSAAGLVTMLKSLAELLAEAAPPQRPALAELQLRVAALLEPKRRELDADEQRTLDTSQAAALAAAGRAAEALRLYERLAAAYPRDGRIQQARAELLQNTQDPAVLRQALDQWRAIEKKSRPGSPRWFEARYAQAEAFYRLGEKASARKLIQLTQVLQPTLGGAELKAKFEHLLALCGE